MVANNEEKNGKYPNLTHFEPGHQSPHDKRPREVRELKRRQIELKTTLLHSISPEELFDIVRQIIEQALGKGDLSDSQLEAATWIVDRCIGKPTKMIEVTQSDERLDEPAKVVLVDWRRNGLDAAPESN